MGKYYGVIYSSYKNSLSHYGIKGQKWGERRYQNEDGSYTPAGKERYGSSNNARMPSLAVHLVADYAVRRATYEIRKSSAKKEIEKAEINKDRKRITDDDIDTLAKKYSRKEGREIVNRMKDNPKMSFEKALAPTRESHQKKVLRN